MTDLGVAAYPTLDLWQIALDGTVVGTQLVGRNTGIGITGYTGLGLPDQRTADQDLPYDHGVIALGDFHRARTLTFGLCIKGDGCDPAASASDAFDQLRTLAGVWQARRDDVVLELRMTNGLTYVMVGRPRRFEANTSGLRRGIIEVAVQFLATDPRLYAIDVDDASFAYEVGVAGDGGLCLTDTANGGGAAQVICLTDTADSGGAAEVLCANDRTTGGGVIVNVGNTDTYPITTFPGPATNPQITNVTTGRILGFVVALGAGDTLVVNHKTRVITRNGVITPTLLGPASDFWPLIPGVNAIQFVHSGGAAASAQVVWRPAWL